MITLIIKSYLITFLSIGLGCVMVFLLGLYLIIKTSSKGDGILPEASDSSSPGEDVVAIAGEDVLSTQLDLARAYIEIDQKTLAQSILASVIQQGNVAQQEEARHLLSYLG